MFKDEAVRRRLYSYFAIAAPIGGVLLIILSKLVLDSGPGSTAAKAVSTSLAVLAGLLLLSTGLLFRRYMTRRVSLTLGVIGMVCFFTIVGPVWAAFWLRDWWRTRRAERIGLRQSLVGAFAWPFTGLERIVKRARELDDEGVVLAYHLPDHTQDAQRVLEREMRSRKLDRFLDPDWLPPPPRATVPPAVFEVMQPERYHAMGRRKEILFRLLRILSLLAVVVVPISYMMDWTGNLLHNRTGLDGEIQSISTAVQQIVALPILLAGGLLMLYVSLSSLIFALGGVLFRNHAGRVLLLRPFAQKRMTASLKQIVRWYLVPAGHVITLSDSNYRPNWFIDVALRTVNVVALILGPLLRPSFRLASISTERAFLHFAQGLHRKYRPSFLNLVCGGQAFNLRATNSWWKRCIDLLMNSCDIIVMDISRIGQGSAWEIDRLLKRGLLTRCLFIVQESHRDESIAVLRKHMPGGSEPQVYVFRDTGEVINSSQFERAISERVNAALATWGRSWVQRPSDLTIGSQVMAPIDALMAAAPGRSGDEIVPAAAPPVPPAPQTPTLRLVPTGAGRSVVVRVNSHAGVVLGRASSADAVLEGNTVSKRHARIFTDPQGRFYVEDIGSNNGTWKGGREIKREPIGDGDVIRFGQSEYRVELSDARRAATSQPAPTTGAPSTRNAGLPPQGQAEPRAPSAAADDEPGAVAWILSGFDDSGHALQFPLRPRHDASETTWTVGRRAERVDLHISQSTVSSEHARLRFSAQHGLEICDLNSANGTYLDDRAVGDRYVAVGKARNIKFGQISLALSRSH